MKRNEKHWAEFKATIDILNPGGPYFIEERISRQMGSFLRAVKDVNPGEQWWEIRYFFNQAHSCWAYLPAYRIHSEFGWGNTLEQAFLNAIFLHVGEGVK
jgi:hypothetical protein